jgi:hypothetical protein
MCAPRARRAASFSSVFMAVSLGGSEFEGEDKLTPEWVFRDPCFLDSGGENLHV